MSKIIIEKILKHLKSITSSSVSVNIESSGNVLFLVDSFEFNTDANVDYFDNHDDIYYHVSVICIEYMKWKVDNEMVKRNEN